MLPWQQTAILLIIQMKLEIFMTHFYSNNGFEWRA